MEVKNSSDAYRAIHSKIADWIDILAIDGFQELPVENGNSSYIDDYMLMAQRMREIEAHTDVDPTPPTDGEGG